MKYLFIDTRSGGDWSLDLLFAGFVKTVGAENVFDYPRKMKHREWTFQTKPDWGLERRTLGYTRDNNEVSSDVTEIREAARFGELTVITDERDESFTEYCRLGLYYMNVPVVVVAGHDRFWNVSPDFVQERFGVRLLHMFIDNWRESYDSLQKTSLINWSANFDHYWERPKEQPEKDIDICFFGYNSHPDRARFIDHILSHPKWKKLRLDIVFERRADTTEVFIPKSEYFGRMLRSKICLNIRGAAEMGKTLRFYEIPYVGSFMLTQKPEDRQIMPFIDLVHCGEFIDETTLDENIERSLYDVQRELIARCSHEHLMKHHTCEARTRYLLERIGHGHSQTV